MLFTSGVMHPGIVAQRLERDRAGEREITDEIGGTLSVYTGAINQMAEQRADTASDEYGAGFPLLSRNLEREGLEELADCRNYIVWRLQSLLWELVEDDGRIPHLQTALRHVVMAFEELRAADRAR